MKQPVRNVAWTLAAALIVGSLAVPASAADRRADAQAGVMDKALATAGERLMATRREFRAIVVDSGLASVDVTDLVDRAEHFADQASQGMMANPEQFHGMTVEDLVAGKMQPVFAAKGLDNITVAHLSALVVALTNQKIELAVEAPADAVAAPVVEESIR